MDNSSSPIIVFVCASLFSIFGGIAYIYRTKEIIKLRDIISSSLNTGLCGLALAMIWYYKFADQIYILMGLCILVSLMGSAGVDWILTKFKTGALSINFNKQDGKLEVKDEKPQQ